MTSERWVDLILMSSETAVLELLAFNILIFIKFAAAGRASPL
jgi:hypothetical protein